MVGYDLFQAATRALSLATLETPVYKRGSDDEHIGGTLNDFWRKR